MTSSRSVPAWSYTTECPAAPRCPPWRASLVRVPASFLCQKRDSAQAGAFQVRVVALCVCQIADSARIFAGDPTVGDGKSMHFRRFGARGGPPPAPSRPPSVHYRTFGAQKRRAPAHCHFLVPAHALPPAPGTSSWGARKIRAKVDNPALSQVARGGGVHRGCGHRKSPPKPSQRGGMVPPRRHDPRHPKGTT